MAQLTLKQHLNAIIDMVAKHPEYLDCKLVYSTDSKTMQFKPVILKLTVLNTAELSGEYQHQTFICIN